MQTMLLPAVSIASSVPGRMRLKLPPYDFSGRENTLRETVYSISGVTDLRWTKLTNSLVVYYDHRQTSSEEILDRCQRVVAPLAAPISPLPTLSFHSSSRTWQPGERAPGGGNANNGPGEKPQPAASAEPLSSGKRLLGIFLVVVGAVLFILPLVPGLPILLMGLTLLQLA